MPRKRWRAISPINVPSWYKTHDEAERLEHAVSADFEAKLVAKLGAGGVCPHGNLVMPETAIALRKRGMQLLSSVDAGHSYRVRSTSERDRKLLEYLDKHGNPARYGGRQGASRRCCRGAGMGHCREGWKAEELRNVAAL